MEYLVLGFITGLSLILAIGAQNIFVIEQGLKKQYVFLVCLICSFSDLILIFSGILLFHFFHQYFNIFVELTLNICLIIFLIYFIYSKIKSFSVSANFNIEKKETTSAKIILKTLGFTYLNAHVYSDTVFFLGNFSKNFLFDEKIYFGIGASIASFIFFFYWVIYRYIFQGMLRVTKHGNILTDSLLVSCLYSQFISLKKQYIFFN